MEYQKLKQELNDKYEHNKEAYIESKTEFIEAVTLKARKEYGRKYKHSL